MQYVRFLTKVIAIYTCKKREFDSKNNNGDNESAYFRLVDNQFYFKFQLEYTSHPEWDQGMPIPLGGFSSNLPNYYPINSGLLPIVMFFLSYEP